MDFTEATPLVNFPFCYSQKSHSPRNGLAEGQMERRASLLERFFLSSSSHPGGLGMWVGHHGSLPESLREGRAPSSLQTSAGAPPPPVCCSPSIVGLFGAWVLASWLPGLHPACPPVGRHLSFPTTCFGPKHLLKSSPWLSSCHPPSSAFRSPLREGGRRGTRAGERPFQERALSQESRRPDLAPISAPSLRALSLGGRCLICPKRMSLFALCT